MPNNRIPLILNVYKKPELFNEQMESLCKQSCVDLIDLHIISNNTKIDFQSMATPFVDKIKIHFVQKNNEYGCFERHLYAHEQQFEYCVFLDDDITFQTNKDLEKIFESRSPLSIKSGWMRQWGKMGTPSSYNINGIESPGTPGKEYNYYGTTLSVFDCEVYNSVMELFPTVNDKLFELHQLKIQDFDDIFISWVCNVSGFKITSHGIKYNMLEHHEALYKQIINKKHLVVNFLNNISPWKSLSNPEYREQQVQQLYRDVLKREADPKGLKHYVDSNLPIDEIKQIFFNSEEYKKITRLKMLK
jgi:hypothetical protein